MDCYAKGIDNEIHSRFYERMHIMKKLTVLSLVLLLAVGLFVTGCKKKATVTDKGQKTEVKAPVEKATEAPAEKSEEAPAEKK